MQCTVQYEVGIILRNIYFIFKFYNIIFQQTDGAIYFVLWGCWWKMKHRDNIDYLDCDSNSDLHFDCSSIIWNYVVIINNFELSGWLRPHALKVLNIHARGPYISCNNAVARTKIWECWPQKQKVSKSECQARQQSWVTPPDTSNWFVSMSQSQDCGWVANTPPIDSLLLPLRCKIKSSIDSPADDILNLEIRSLNTYVYLLWI